MFYVGDIMITVPYDDKISCILTFQEDLWDFLLTQNFGENSSWIDISTLNFNFENRLPNSMYTKLKQLGNKGVDIRLIFSKPIPENIDMDDLEPQFTTSVVAYFLNDPNEINHSKIFLSESVGYIGSANFSYSSQNNFECGVLIKDRELLKKIRKELFVHLYSHENFKLTSIPDSLYLEETLKGAKSTVESYLAACSRETIDIDENLMMHMEWYGCLTRNDLNAISRLLHIPVDIYPDWCHLETGEYQKTDREIIKLRQNLLAYRDFYELCLEKIKQEYLRVGKHQFIEEYKRFKRENQQT